MPKKRQKRPRELCALEPHPAKKFDLTSPPTGKILRLCANQFAQLGGSQDPPILTTDDPRDTLERMHTVQAYTRRIRGNNKGLVRDLAQFILEYGGLIQTNDPRRRFVFDHERFQQLALVESRGASALDSDYDRQTRLLQLLGLAPKEEPVISDKPEAPASPEQKTEEAPVVPDEPKPPVLPEPEVVKAADPPPSPPAKKVDAVLKPGEIRAFIALVAAEKLNGLTTTYPDMERFAELLGLLGSHSVRGRESAIAETTENLASLLFTLRDQIDDDALSIIESLEPQAGEAEPSVSPVQWIEEEIRRLKQAKSPIEEEDRRLSTAKTQASDLLEQLEVEVLEQGLQVRLDHAPPITVDPLERPKLEAAIDRTQQEIERLEDYIDQLNDLLRPIRQTLDALNRRINALRLASQGFEITTSEQIQIPEPPQVDIRSLEDWESIQLDVVEPVTPTTDQSMLDQEYPEQTDRPTRDTSDLADLRKYHERLVLACFGLLARKGHRTAFKVARVLKEIGLLEPEIQVCVGIVQGSCSRLCDEDDPKIVWRGTVGKRFHCYKATETLPASLVDEMLTIEQQTQLLEAFAPKKKKR